jgi:chromosome segregation ATPase
MSDSINAIDVAYETEVSIESKSTEQLTAEANTLYHQAERLAGMSAMMLAETGRRLIEVKSRIPHGEFGKWCEENLEFSYRKAARTMQLAEKMDDENSLFSKMPTLANIGISRVWALLAAPEEVAAEVVENNDVESMKVRELQDEIAKVKAEKEAAERKANTLEGNNDSIRKELASMQRELAESVTEKEFNEMQAAAQAQKEDLTKELNEAKAESGAIQAKLDKAKEDLKKLKAKQKELESAKDEEVQKSIEAVRTEIVKKAKDDAYAESAADLEQNAKDIRNLQERIETLEAEKTKLSNTALMEFKVYVDQLQDIYDKLNDMITEESLKDEELGAKMQMALQTVVGRWRP